MGSVQAGQVFLGKVAGGGAVAHRGHHLPHRLGAHIAHGKNAGQTGAGGLIRLDVLLCAQVLLQPVIHQT